MYPGGGPGYPPGMRAVLILAPLLLGNVDIPTPVKAMLDAAIAGGNPSEVAIVEKYARTASPDSAEAITQLANAWRTERETARLARLRDAGPWQLWTGNAEIGGYVTTGNTQDIGVSGQLNLQRETVRWRHKMRLAADYQESRGLVSREHYLAAYEPNFKFSPRGYVYGAAQYESDRFLGYDNRYSTSIGAGYSLLKSARTKLDLELGPAYRYVEFTDSVTQSAIAARGTVDFQWRLTSGLSISQIASAYVQQDNSTVSGTTAVTAKLIGPLSASLSYNVQYESTPPIGSVSTDTTSRAALVYSF